MPPKMRPKRPQSAPKSISKINMKKKGLLEPLGEHFWSFWLPLGGKNNQNPLGFIDVFEKSRFSTRKRFETHFGSFWARFGSHFASQNRAQMLPETDQKTRLNFDRFLIDFGSKMGAQMAPRSDPIWAKNRSKNGQNPKWPPDAILDRFWVVRGSIWSWFWLDLGSIWVDFLYFF